MVHEAPKHSPCFGFDYPLFFSSKAWGNSMWLFFFRLVSASFLISLLGCATSVRAIDLPAERQQILLVIENHFKDLLTQNKVDKEVLHLIKEFRANSFAPLSYGFPDTYNLFALFDQLRVGRFLELLDELDPGEEPLAYHVYQTYLATREKSRSPS